MVGWMSVCVCLCVCPCLCVCLCVCVRVCVCVSWGTSVHGAVAEGDHGPEGPYGEVGKSEAISRPRVATAGHALASIMTSRAK